MKILSWDVGIYNLCYCILEKNETDGKINIIGWDIVNLVDNDKMKKNKTELFENIPIKLQEIPQLLNVDYVVIENQPSLKNPQMKSIQMILYSYFIILGKAVNFGEFKNIKNIDFCSASNKLKVYDGPKIVFQEKVKKPPKLKKGEVAPTPTPLPIVPENIIKDEEGDEIVNTDVAEVSKKKPTLKYADKKKLAIAHAQYYIDNNFTTYKDFFSSHKKKDDLSDSLLQGLYYIKVGKPSFPLPPHPF
jgi:hypothetical protein